MNKQKNKKYTSPFVGLKDIAKRCEVSAMTVSRALRNVPGVNPETRRKVLQAANELGYVPNMIASNLISKKTNTVGVMVPDIGVTIFPSVLKGIESVLSRENYRIFICCTSDDPGKEYQEAQALLKHRVDGIIMAPSSTRESREIVGRILGSGCSLVFIDRIIPGLDVSAVTVNDYESTYEAVTHMIGQGFTRIAHLAGPPNVWTANERLRAYKQAMRDAGMKVSARDIITAGFTVEGGIAGMERMLDRKQRPDAVFCVNDPVALGAYQVLRKNGIEIPRAMGLAGFSNLREAELTAVPLTSVTHDVVNIGQQSARILLTHMRTPDPADRKLVFQELKSHLVVRQSTLLKP